LDAFSLFIAPHLFVSGGAFLLGCSTAFSLLTAYHYLSLELNYYGRKKNGVLPRGRHLFAVDLLSTVLL